MYTSPKKQPERKEISCLDDVREEVCLAELADNCDHLAPREIATRVGVQEVKCALEMALRECERVDRVRALDALVLQVRSRREEVHEEEGGEADEGEEENEGEARGGKGREHDLRMRRAACCGYSGPSFCTVGRSRCAAAR
jgi:hypothetical protein